MGTYEIFPWISVAKWECDHSIPHYHAFRICKVKLYSLSTFTGLWKESIAGFTYHERHHYWSEWVCCVRGIGIGGGWGQPGNGPAGQPTGCGSGPSSQVTVGTGRLLFAPCLHKHKLWDCVDIEWLLFLQTLEDFC